MKRQKPQRRGISQRSELVYDWHEFNVNIDTREIFLGLDPLTPFEDAMVDHINSSMFIRNLVLLNSMGSGTILVHMNMCGGDWNYGMAIHNAIQDSVKDPNASDIVVLAYAHSRSMSSIIPQAATWRVIHPDADFLIHFGEWGYSGNYSSAMAEADWSKRSEQRMIDIYAERCVKGPFFLGQGMEIEEVRKWLKDNIDKKEEFYMTPRQAVNYGFMDAVLGDEEFEHISVLRDKDE